MPSLSNTFHCYVGSGASMDKGLRDDLGSQQGSCSKGTEATESEDDSRRWFLVRSYELASPFQIPGSAALTALTQAQVGR